MLSSWPAPTCTSFLVSILADGRSSLRRMNGMPEWPATRVTLLDRLRDPRDHEAWVEFVSLYGPLVFQFARRRLPQEEDAGDVMQEVLSAVMQGRYQRPKGRFQKWIVTVLLNKIRDFHAALARRCEVLAGPEVTDSLS